MIFSKLFFCCSSFSGFYFRLILKSQRLQNLLIIKGMKFRIPGTILPIL